MNKNLIIGLHEKNLIIGLHERERCDASDARIAFEALLEYTLRPYAENPENDEVRRWLDNHDRQQFVARMQAGKAAARERRRIEAEGGSK